MSLFRVENGAFYRNKKVIFEKMNFEISCGEVLALSLKQKILILDSLCLIWCYWVAMLR